MKPMKKRLLSLLLTLVTILSLLPTAAFAASNTGSGLKITTNQAYWSTRLLANGTPYSYRPPLVDGKLVYCMDSGLGYARMTMVDEMDFGSLGEKKKAIFCVIPVDDSSMNYLVGMLYTQCFQALYRRADEKHNGRLPVPVRVIQDEWANVAQPESYPKILATCRSYNIGLNIIVQNIQQIKALYEKEWESIIGNCDTLLFLGGGNEPTSLEFIVKLLGKETIATRTRGETKGRSGSSSTNFQQTGRDLMTIDEVRKLDTHKAILFIRGEDPVLDKKYNIKRHPNIKLTTDGKAKPYTQRA